MENVYDLPMKKDESNDIIVESLNLQSHNKDDFNELVRLSYGCKDPQKSHYSNEVQIDMKSVAQVRQASSK